VGEVVGDLVFGPRGGRHGGEVPRRRGIDTPETIVREFEAAARDIPDQPRDGVELADYAAAVESDSGEES